jgi:hypothetical protein
VAEARAGTEVSWGAATRTCPGKAVSGDLAVVHPAQAGTLFAAVDGAGRGAPAARAAQRAREVLARLVGPDLQALLAGTHEALKPTRGVALALAFVPTAGRTLSWVAVGNVAGVVMEVTADGRRRSTWLRTPGGVAGHALPATVPAVVELRHGDVLILTTDGVDTGFGASLELHGRPGDIAERILARHWSGTDDAVALVARFLGDPA